MKNTRLMVCLAAAGAALALVVPQANAGISFSFSVGSHINSVADFHAPLADLGVWVNAGPYGQCWHPRDVPGDWRPYCNGSWEWTDAGWYWQSDEAWAPECYHYGSWVDDSTYGWVWIPGTDWAPAWVTWRDSDDYIGWAPCGPGESAPPPQQFCFVDAHNFGEPIHRDNVIINNRTIIDRTREVRDFRRESHDVNGVNRTIVVNRGPDVNVVQRATGRQFHARPIGQVEQNRRPIATSRQPERNAVQGQPQRRPVNEPAGAQTQQPERRALSQPGNTQARQPQSRMINEPAGAQAPVEQQRQRAAQQAQSERLRQENASQHASRPDQPATRAPQAAAPQREYRSAEPTPRAAEPTPRTAPRQSVPTIREPAGAERVAPQPTPPRSQQSRQAPTIREPAGAQRVAPERETVRPAQRPVESRPTARPTPPAPQREPPPARSAQPERDKKQPQS